MADTPRWIDVDFEFPDLRLYWTSHIPNVPGANRRSIGAQFVGTEGSLVADYGSRVLFLEGRELKDLPEVPKSIPRSPGHQRNFLDCVKSRKLTESHLEYAHRMTTPLHLSIISHRLKRKIWWDAERERCRGDEEATRMLSIPYRAPWWLPT